MNIKPCTSTCIAICGSELQKKLQYLRKGINCISDKLTELPDKYSVRDRHFCQINHITSNVLSGQRNPSAEMTTLALNARNRFKISSAPAVKTTS